MLWSLWSISFVSILYFTQTPFSPWLEQNILQKQRNQKYLSYANTECKKKLHFINVREPKNVTFHYVIKGYIKYTKFTLCNYPMEANTMKCKQAPLTPNKTHKPINWPAIPCMIREFQKLVMSSNILSNNSYLFRGSN